MTIPTIPRHDPPYVADEREMLVGWLEFHRATLLHKCAGLTDEQLIQAACPPSNLTLLGLVRHMAEVERNWFSHRFGDQPVEPLYWREDQPDYDFEAVASADPAADFAIFTKEIEQSRRAVATRSLDEVFEYRKGGMISLRWVYIHMIEEYARHNGHADLLRERIDGVTGE
ncbi:DinB family protein [Natronosporangium hydrolyticum]|uniref:DinB family protein n=1 Tax=Natronosporangium hydrolyticum TaxID=2811111 RepID=A0A895YDS6_9ACTN|nr:DinB family protein [Natronosporangium hydrolyticum]QSB13549.1 DinB family protein [Natronosporangium hydrolyticum]